MLAVFTPSSEGSPEGLPLYDVKRVHSQIGTRSKESRSICTPSTPSL
jgi:hypothetical protein